MSDRLLRDAPRIGNLFDGDGETPQPRAMLQQTDTGVLLTIPWDGGETTVYRRWFAPNAHWDDDPDRTKFTYEVPNTLVFRDVFGSVHLIGCRPVRGPGSGSLRRQGQGNVRANIGVFGGVDRVDFSTIHGLRTQVSGLRSWIGAQSIHRDGSALGPNGAVSVTYTARSPEPIEIPSYPSLTLAPWWTTEPSDGAMTLREQLYIVSRFADPVDWVEHLNLHTAMRNLVSMSAWAPQAFTGIQCLHDESPTRSLGGSRVGDEWLEATTVLVDVVPSSRSGAVNHLIEYDDLGPEGLAKWLDLRRDFERAIAPIEASVYLSDATVEVKLMQVGAGLEALAYLLLLREGASKKEAEGAWLIARLRLIAERVQSAIPFDGEEWAVSTTEAYNAVKHANRDLPDPVDLANCWRESVLAFRIWLALELGVTAEDLKSRVESDDQTRPYVAS